MTYLQLVNAVLTRLREETVSTVSDTDYSALIGIFVNDAKREVEDAWNWSSLRTTASITTVASTDTYSVDGTNERTRLLDAYNTTQRVMMLSYGTPMPINYYNTLSTVTSSPLNYDVVGVDYADNNKLKIRLYPIPDGVYSILFHCVVPQDDLSADADVLQIPADPVIQGAYLRAINERGEDQGRLSDIQQEVYTKSVASYMSIDAENYSAETTWYPI